MELEDINADSTADDVKDYARQVAKEVEAERAGQKPDEKGDAQIVAEHADNEHKETTAETKSGSEAAKPAKGEGEKVDESGEKSDTSKDAWFDEDLKAEVAAYGIEESELADFASREELERALRLFDKSALEAGRKALAETEGKGEATGRNEKGQFAKVEQKETPKSESLKEGAYEIKLNKEVYDEEIVGEFTRLRDHYESRLDAMESRFLEADAKAEEHRFDAAIDKLNMPELFGKTGSESKKELEIRSAVLQEVKTYLLGRNMLGRPMELDDASVSRMARALYSEEFGKKDLKTRTRKISKQSNGRQGGGATRPQDPREDPRDEADRLYKELAGT